jgi:thermitase
MSGHAVDPTPVARPRGPGNGLKHLHRGALGLALLLAAVVAALVPGQAAAAGAAPKSFALAGQPPEPEQTASGGLTVSSAHTVQSLTANFVIVTFGHKHGSHKKGFISAAQERAQIASAKAHIAAMKGVTVLGSVEHLPVQVLKLAAAQRRQLAAQIKKQAGVQSVQRDVIEAPTSIECLPSAASCVFPNEGNFRNQWWLYNFPGMIQPPEGAEAVNGTGIDAPHAWKVTTGSPAVKVAVVDSGIDPGQPELAGRIVATANFTQVATSNDRAGHGTHVAGIIGGSFSGPLGIVGVAPNAQLMNVKVLAVDETGEATGDCADVAQGIIWATQNGANIINMSLGSPTPCQAMELAVEYAWNNGVLVVAAAGNNGTTSLFYPAAFPNVVSVAASDNGGRVAGFSDRGSEWVDIAAPGVGILSTLPTYANGTGETNTGFLSGTSMATPVVSGVAALVWGLEPPSGTAALVRERLFATAHPVRGTERYWKYGIVNACLAVTNNQGPCGLLAAQTSGKSRGKAKKTASGLGLSGSGLAALGTYAGSLGRGRLRLKVGDGGSAVVGLTYKVTLGCERNLRVSLRGTALSTASYAAIDSANSFSVRLPTRGVTLSSEDFQVSGTFSGRSVHGKLRVTGRNGGRRCDSGDRSFTLSLR